MSRTLVINIFVSPSFYLSLIVVEELFIGILKIKGNSSQVNQILQFFHQVMC